MKLRFPYKKIQATKGSKPAVIRPIIPIELAAKNKERVRTEALIDSGADMSMFHWEIAEVLGLDKADALYEDKFSGVLGKPALYYVFEIFMILGGDNRIITQCGFTEYLPNAAHGFLGQNSFFHNYQIEFIHKKEIVRIRDKGN